MKVHECPTWDYSKRPGAEGLFGRVLRGGNAGRTKIQ